MGAGHEEIAPIRLETDRLVLRDVVESDVAGFQAYMTDPAYVRYLPLDPMDPAAVQALIDRVVLRQATPPRDWIFLAVMERASGRLVGEAIFKILDAANGQGEIGWGVAGPDQGRGIATEIGRALLRFGFIEHKLHRLIARCEIGNAASERVMAKLGMTKEGVLRDHLRARGRWWTSAQWSMLTGEHEQKHRHPRAGGDPELP
jgi:RimJ/RimL family protein N-acetyltransferase